MVIAQLGHLLGLLSLSQYTRTGGEWIYWWEHVWLPLQRVEMLYAPFSWLLLDLFPADQLCHIPNQWQVSKQQAGSVLNRENMDNFTELLG